jgi:hypothetical protein
MRSLRQPRTAGRSVALVWCAVDTAVLLIPARRNGRRGLPASAGRATLSAQPDADALLASDRQGSWPGPTVAAPTSAAESSGQAQDNAGHARKALSASLTIVCRHIRDVAEVAAVVRRILARSAKNDYQGRHRRKRRHT